MHYALIELASSKVKENTSCNDISLHKLQSLEATPGVGFQVAISLVCEISIICRLDFHSGGVLRNRLQQPTVVVNVQ